MQALQLSRLRFFLGFDMGKTAWTTRGVRKKAADCQYGSGRLREQQFTSRLYIRLFETDELHEQQIQEAKHESRLPSSFQTGSRHEST
jgi:hypothetical protein